MRTSLRRSALALTFATLVCAACTVKTNPNAAGTSCSSDSDCEASLRCAVGIGMPGGGCLFPTSGQCTRSCSSDADCASLTPPDGKSGFSCTTECKDSTKSFCAVH